MDSMAGSIFIFYVCLPGRLDAVADQGDDSSNGEAHHSSGEDRKKVDVVEKLMAYSGEGVDLSRALLEVGVHHGERRDEG
ncbi:hypothetical protein PENTCL1PPCAC_5189, partial [Pristionchus entomophagus]